MDLKQKKKTKQKNKKTKSIFILFYNSPSFLAYVLHAIFVTVKKNFLVRRETSEIELSPPLIVVERSFYNKFFF